MPFIKYTKTTGGRQILRFINVDRIAEAEYDETSTTLSVVVTDKQGGQTVIKLDGNEAIEAARTIQDI